MPWIHAATRSAFDGRNVIGVDCGGRRLALYALADGIHATSDACPHLGGALSEGCVVEGFIECPQHFALFDIRTGAADGSVTDESVTTYPVKVDADDIYVELPAGEKAT